MKTIDINKKRQERLKKEKENEPEELEKLKQMSERFKKESEKWPKKEGAEEEPGGPMLGPDNEVDSYRLKKRIMRDLKESMEDEE